MNLPILIMIMFLLVSIRWKLDELEHKLSFRGRDNVVDECIKQLGGRYGAAATKDLQSIKSGK